MGNVKKKKKELLDLVAGYSLAVFLFPFNDAGLSFCLCNVINIVLKTMLVCYSVFSNLDDAADKKLFNYTLSLYLLTSILKT